MILLLVACLFAAARPGQGQDGFIPGQERVLSFRSEITILPDASLAVRETIRVRAAQREINHGIYRDFPTRYRSPEGQWASVPFRLTEVLRNGKPEPWQTKERENGIRAYFGDADLPLEPGEHTYTVTYRTDRQLGYFNDHVELHWNVTGHQWTMPIDEIEARVLLPRGVAGVSLEAHTGALGSKGRDATAAWNGDGGAAFRATRAFLPGEALTVTVRWPRGHVQEPPEAKSWWRFFLGGNRSVIAGLAGLLLVLTYHVLVGRHAARKPERGTGTLPGEVPSGLSPAAVRVVRTGRCDERAFAATVVSMAIKGYLVIETGEGGYTLRRGGMGEAVLSPEEALVAQDLHLQRAEHVVIERANHVRIGGAVNGLKNFLRVSLERSHAIRNRELLLPGVALSVVVLGSTLTLEPGLWSFTRILISLLLFFWTIWGALLAVQLVGRWLDVILRRGFRRDARFHAAAVTVFAIPFFLAEIAGLGLVTWLGSYSYGALLVGVALLNVRFHYHLKTPSSAGRGLVEEIERFADGLAGTADQGALRSRQELNPAVYERFLPYAIALELEKEWSRQCADALARAGADGCSYHPAWLQTASGVGGGAPTFVAGAAGDALSAAIASSAGAR